MPSNARPAGGDGQGASSPKAMRRALRPAIAAAIPFVAGILAAYAWSIPIALSLAGVALLVISAFFLSLARRRTIAAACLLGAIGFLGILRATLDRRDVPDPANIAPLSDRPIEIVGRIVSDPALADGRWRFGLAADTVRADAVPRVIGRAGLPGFVATGPVTFLAIVDTAAGAARYGAVVRARGTIRLPRPSAPGTIDRETWLRRRGYVATFSAQGAGVLTTIEPAAARTRSERWHAAWADARGKIRRMATRGLDGTAAGLQAGLLLGDRTDLPHRVLEEFQRCGVIHILSVSGLHVGMVLLGIGWPLRRIFGPRAWMAPLLVAAAWGYVFLTGSSPPAVRSAIMATVLLAGMARRRFDPGNALAVAALGTLACDPAAILDVGFQLSYAAMAGIFTAAAFFPREIPALRRLSHTWPNRALRWTGRLALGFIVATIGAQVVTTPLVAHHFGVAVLAGIAGSPVIVALVTLAVWGGIVLVAGGWIAPVATVAGTIIDALLRAALAVAAWAADLPLAATDVRPPGWSEVAAYLGALAIATGIGMREVRRSRVRGAVLAISVAVLLSGNVAAWSAWAHRSTGFAAAFLDVGQGDATLMTFPNGATVLVDAGPADDRRDAGERVVVPYCRARGIRRIDLAIATHGDNDHAGGLAAVLERIPVGELRHNGCADTSATWRRIMAVARRRGVPIGRLAAGDTIVGLGIPATVLGPPRGGILFDLWPENDRSVVLAVVPYGRPMLLTGDVGRDAEHWLARRWGDRLRADGMKVAHHGSATGTSGRILAVAHPAWAAISVGAGNLYGHPAPRMLARLDSIGTRVLRTDHAGTIVWRVLPDTAWWESADGERIFPEE